jgi:hypothetical protein
MASLRNLTITILRLTGNQHRCSPAPQCPPAPGDLSQTITN